MYRIYTVRYIHSYVLAALNLYSGGTSARYSLLDPIQNGKASKYVPLLHRFSSQKRHYASNRVVVKYRFRSAMELSHKLTRYGRKRVASRYANAQFHFC